MKVRIGELSKMTGCRVVTIRYYERQGLMGEPERTGSNYRLYGDADIARLRFILSCRQHGLTLAEIREMLSFRDNPTVNCQWIHSLVRRHIASVDRQIASLEHLKGHLLALLGPETEGGAHCGVLEHLGRHEYCQRCEEMRGRLEEASREVALAAHARDGHSRDGHAGV